MAYVRYVLVTYECAFVHEHLFFPIVKPSFAWVPHLVAAIRSVPSTAFFIQLCAGTRAYPSAKSCT